MSSIFNMGLTPEDFITLGIPFYFIVIFVILLKRFLSAEDDNIRKQRKKTALVSGILAGAVLLAALGYWIYSGIGKGTSLLGNVIFSLWLIFAYVIGFLIYNLSFSMPIAEIIWFAVMLIQYKRAAPEHKREWKIKMFVTGGIAVIHVLALLVLTIIFR